MNFFIIYTFLFFLIALTIHHVYRLKQKYPSTFVRMFFYYIAIYYIWFFLNLTPKLIFSQTGIEHVGSLQIIISVMSLPLMISGFYLFLIFSERLVQFQLPKWIKWTFWIVQFIFFSIFLLLSVFITQHGTTGNMKILFLLLKIIPMVSASLPPIIMIFFTRHLSDKRGIIFSRTLGIYYLIAYPLMFLILEFWEVPFHLFQNPTQAFSMVMFIVYIFNILPIFYVTLFLKKHVGYFSGEPIPDDRQKIIIKEMKITHREWDIIKLILQGKTNPEIGDLLFISTKTVKNNLTEIYRKLNVRNRVQMVRKISLQIDTKD